MRAAPGNPQKKPPHVIAVFTFSFFAKPLRRLVHHVIYRRKTI
jgi:hypothetical protein